MRFDLRAKIFTAYAVVLVLGAALATLVFVFGGHVLDASRTLVREDVPRLEDISALKADISGQVTILYEYYAEDCDDAQGYLFGRPVPADQFEASLRTFEIPGKTQPDQSQVKP